MCAICGKSPCAVGCPNEEQKAVYTCKYCGEEILEGEEYVELDGVFYHDDCFEDDAIHLLLERYGAKRGVAEVDDGYEG